MSVNVNPAFLTNIGQHLVSCRNALNAIVQDGTYINAMGGADFLEAAPFNLDSDDAASLAATIGGITAENETVQAVLAFLASAITFTAGS